MPADGGNWRGEGWPGPEARARQRLPRVDDLPAAEHGYDRERVREAFDAFYRHIAQLDSTLRALEAVEVFRDQAGELRKELRALKVAGWTQQPWPGHATGRVSPGLPESLPRFAIEAAFLIVVAVVVAVASFDRLSIVLVMAFAWSIVGVVEWAASRERFAKTRVPAPGRAQPEPAPAAPLRIVPATNPVAGAPSEDWAAAAGDEDDEEARQSEEELTFVEAAPDPQGEADVPVEATPAADGEPSAVEGEVELETEPAEAELAVELEPLPANWSWAADVAVERARERERAEDPPMSRRRFWQRRADDGDGFRFDPKQPRHVRVLPPVPSFDEQFPVEASLDGVDPWEQELDLSIEEPEGSVEPESEPEPESEDELEPAFAERDAGETS